MWFDSPFHEKGGPFTDAMLEATVEEAKGVDVHMLQPGMGWVPWWQSDVLPIEEHYAWFKDHYGIEPASAYVDYMRNGGDMIATFVAACRKRNITPFISLRLNDVHHLEFYEKPEPFMSMSLCKFYRDHMERRVGPDMTNWYHRGLDWIDTAPRDYKLAFIREICEKYDIDGFELDFMRHFTFFTTPEHDQRIAIMTEFVGKVREILDQTAKPGQHRWLCARMPCFLGTMRGAGLDAAKLQEAGVDMFDLSAYYHTQQENDIAGIRKAAPRVALYYEMTHCTMTGVPTSKAYDSFDYMRTTDEQFFTTAHLAYERGVDGISLFNFPYFRGHGTEGRGPFNEPPFHILSHLGDRDFVRNQGHWYFLHRGFYVWSGKPRPPLPEPFKNGERKTFLLDMAPAGNLRDGLLRIMTEKNAGNSTWTVYVNGHRLASSDFVRKPFEHPYEAALGQPEQYRCFVCSVGLIFNGRNEVTIVLEGGGPQSVNWIGVSFPTKA